MLANMLGAMGAGSLGTLFVQLSADSTRLIRGMQQAELAVEGGARRILASSKLMAGGLISAYAAIGAASLKTFMDFETSFAGVKKTIDATDAEFAKLEQTFRRMAREMPSSVVEINRVAEAAGQLGIHKGALEGFTKTMIDMGHATNLTSDEAATAMAKIATVMQMPQNEFDRMASTIVGLGASSNATEKEIVEMSMRIAGAGRAVGMTVPQVIGFATALASVGIEAEMGGSAISQTMIMMSKAVKQGSEELHLFAAAAGLTADQFKIAFETNAAGTIVRFVQGLQQMQKNGEDTFTLMERLGVEGLRQTDTLNRLSGAGGMLNQTLREGNRHWEENRSLAGETEKRYATLAAQLTITWNRIKDIAISIGEQLAPAVRILNDMWKTATDEQDKFASSSEKVGRIFTGPLIFAVGAVGDAIMGWRMIIKTGQLLFLKLAETGVNAFENLTYVIGFTLERAAQAYNKFKHLLPGGILLPRIQKDDFGGSPKFLTDTVEALRQASADVEQELVNLAANKPFSRQFTEQYDQMVNAAKAKTQELGQSHQKAAEDAIRAWAEGTGYPALPIHPSGSVSGLVNQKQAMEDRVRSMQFPLGGLNDPMAVDPALAGAIRFSEEKKQMEDTLKEIKTIQDSKIQLEKDTQSRLIELETAYLEKRKQLQEAQKHIVLASAISIGDSLVSIAENLAGKQSGIYKVMFATSKAFAIADASVKIMQGIASAAALPWPANLAAIASTVAATASIISNIQAIQLEFGGGKMKGGSVSAGSYYMVGESGPELFAPGQAGSIIPNDKLGTRVVINNYTDGKATVSERRQGDESIIDVVIKRAEDYLASGIRDGSGSMTKAMEASYGLRRGRA